MGVLSKLFGTTSTGSATPAGSGGPTLQQLCVPLFASAIQSRDDESRVAEARSLMSNRQWREATDVVQLGLQSCQRKDRLCELMANIRMNERNPVAIGWYMQACVLASPSWVPYLLVAYAARPVGMESLAWRCLNACDVIDTGMKRIEALETDIRTIAKAANRSELLAAMKSFEVAMDPYLPPPDAIPHDQESRSVALLQNIAGSPSEPPDCFRTRLRHRP